MLRLRSPLGLWLILLVLGAGAGSAWAGPAAGPAQHTHSPARAAAIPAGDQASAGALAPIDSMLAAAPEPSHPGWPALLVVLAAAALAWRRPRRALALAVAVLLAVLAFEDGLHSVHHGLDPNQTATCAVAAASAQLSAVSVDAAVAPAPDLPAVQGTSELTCADPAARSLRPDLGRAPPQPTV